MSAMLGDFLLR